MILWRILFDLCFFIASDALVGSFRIADGWICFRQYEPAAYQVSDLSDQIF